jgi:N-acetylmuramoyl-L-alanine amidase
VSSFLRWSILAAVLTCVVPPAAPASPAATRVVRQIRFSTGAGRTRVVLDCSAETRYTAHGETAPYRVVVDLPGCSVSSKVRDLEVRDGAIERIRVASATAPARIVIELAEGSRFDHFALKPGAGKPHRIVIDVSRGAAPPGTRPPGGGAGSAPASRPPARTADRVVIIDAGHGGPFVGCVSRSGVQEKTLTLKLAKMLKADIERHPGYRAILVREKDCSLGKTRVDDLVRRIDFAREKCGDLFVSLHFNSNFNRKIRGLELYFLSLEASDENAGAVAERENLLVDSGADSGDAGDELASILFDVSLANAIQGSALLAEDVSAALRDDPPIAFRKIKQAPFLVLRGLSMPSILVEGGYLSNRQEAAIIAKDSYLAWLSKSLAKGIVAFLDTHPRPEAAMGGQAR